MDWVAWLLCYDSLAFLYGFNTNVCIPNSIKFGFWKLSSKNKTSYMSKRATLSLLKEGSWGKNKLVSRSQFINLQEPLLVNPEAWKTLRSLHREIWRDCVNCTLQRGLWRRPFCSSWFCAFWRFYDVKLVKILSSPHWLGIWPSWEGYLAFVHLHYCF